MEDVISVSFKGKDVAVMYTPEKMEELLKIAEKSETVTSMDELNSLIEEVEAICKNAEADKINEIHDDLFKDPKTNKYYLRISKSPEIISSFAIPEVTVNMIEQSIDKGIDVDPIMKFLIRLLRNKKAGDAAFMRYVCEYISMTYVRPNILQEKLDEGYNEEVATQLATVYQVKLTKEGLINAFKISKEVDWKYVPGEDGGDAVRKPLYERTFDAVTGEVTGSTKDILSNEDRIFYPAVQGLTGGDAFYCDGVLGHIIKVGATHRLDNWDQVDCTDMASCRPGLHVGGLDYISSYRGEIHNVFVDPMHIGAIADYDTGAMRVFEYHVHDSFVGVNSSLYHSSAYAEKTDKQWSDLKAEILKDFGTKKETNDQLEAEVKAL
jgi:hypothetical protein